MVSHAGGGGVRPFLQLLEVQALRSAADRDLLGRVAAADEAAFRVVAERHGPMVFGVCARVLGNRHDAEDALQATFLVLARRAAAVRKSESLASWLHGVARRVALRLRRATRRRTARERAAAAAPDSQSPADALAWAEVRTGLDEELARLPAAYRDVLVLCYLEGLTRDEAARQLGLDPGAVKGRLERGRRLLGERLLKRGIGLSVGLAAVAVAPDATAALRLGRLASNPAAASPRAAALTHEFLKGVAMTKLKVLSAGVVGVMVLAVGVGTAQPPPAKEPPAKGLLVPPALLDPTKSTDDGFLRHVSQIIRGTDPTPAELYFFLATKDANKRAVVIDLFLKEKAEKAARKEAAGAVADQEHERAVRLIQEQERQVAERVAAERAKRDVAEAQRRAAEADEQARLDAARRLREAQPTKAPNTALPTPGSSPKTAPVPTPPAKATEKSSRGLFEPTPPPAAPAPAATGELLRVKVKLAELTVREKALVVTQLEEQVKRGLAPAGDLARAKLDVERAELLLLEARLTVEQAERARP